MPPMMAWFMRSGCIEIPIVNPDAEILATTGWTNVQGALNYRYETGTGLHDGGGRPAPNGGVSIFDGGTDAVVRAEQEFDLSTLLDVSQLAALDAGDFRFKLDWLGGTFIQANPDQPRMLVHFRAASGASDNPIWRYDSGLKNPSTSNGVMLWSSYHEEHRIPPGTRYMAIEMYAFRRTGTNNDAAFDNIAAEICREPPTGADPWFEFVALLAGFEGADGATTYTEESRHGAAVTFSDTAHIETTDAIEGTSSLKCGPTSGIASIASSDALVFGNYDWTIEFSFVLDATPSASTGPWLFTKYQATGNERSLGIYVNSGSFNLRLSSNGTATGTPWFQQNVSFTPVVGTRYNVRWVRKADTSYFFVDGVLLSTQALPTANYTVFATTQPVRIGGSGSGSSNEAFDGRIDEVRVTIGVARSIADYTPAFPFPRD